METPIIDFIKKYNEAKTARFHMPGHKGVSFLGFENIDITEIKGADDLSCPTGIIKQSEENASGLFKTKCTVFSVGGSTQSVNAMLFLAYSVRDKSGNPVVLAARNAHKSFVFAVAKIGAEVEWLYPEKSNSLCSAVITAEVLENKLKQMKTKPFAVYITTPDYLGNVTDVKSLSEVCRKYNIPLLADNAHGAYSAFLNEPFHPVQNGADLCCDSAHKTLPAITGCGYLHIEKNDYFGFSKKAHNAMTVFGTSSPSYLLLQSLDLCNKYIYEKIEDDLLECSEKVKLINRLLNAKNIKNISCEPIKITMDFSTVQSNNFDFAEHFRSYNIEFEYSDKNYIVFMASAYNSADDFNKLASAVNSLPEFSQSTVTSLFDFVKGEQVMSVRDAVFADSEEIPVEDAVGRVCGAPTVSCPPAIPIVVSGEKITEEHIALLKYYDKTHIRVVI
ncbi:MAG: aminotransferase class V-fold PLP-dependent enzyme [Clostridia bacterium]|nr:aminotransferase class V-fold PLP-dependent enzyme [Clostridia bacterium]